MTSATGFVGQYRVIQKLSYRFGMLGCVTAVKLREWRGVKSVASPSGVAITTRFRTTPDDERVLDLVADHLGGLRRADLGQVCHPVPLDPSLDGEAKHQARRDRLNIRKTALTAQSSARWANAIIAGNDAQYRSARDAQHRHMQGLRAAIDTIEKRLARPTGDTRTPEQRRDRRKAKRPKGYATQAERFEKQRRLQRLRAELSRMTADGVDKRAEKPWAEAPAANASAERLRVSPRPCSATGWPRRPTATASVYMRSIPLTPARGEISTGAPHMRTSPDTRQQPR
jgi:hypothetical protein